MCGILGYIKCGSPLEISKGLEVINHRGPDFRDFKWFEEHSVGLGHARLSIIDLSNDGNQPMYDPISGNWIVYNGEVYNFESIRKKLRALGMSFQSNSDTEVILKSYRAFGEEAFKEFNGMFAFAIFNEKSGKTVIVRDRLGIKPLYIWQEGNKLAFASEIKSILELSEYPKAYDLRAIHTQVHYQASPDTGFKGIRKVPAGTYMIYENDKIQEHTYWDIQPEESDLSFEEAKDSLESLLHDSIRLQLISDVPVGALLSGGLDSSLISVLMQNQMDKPLNTFTIKFSDDDLKRQGNVSDAHYARLLADQQGFNHHELLIKPDIVGLLPKMVWHMDEPIADPAAINSFLIAEEARKRGIKVLLSGMGADEFFAGYRSQLACLKADSYQKTVPKHIRTLIESIVGYLPESNANRNFKYIRWLKGFMKIGSLSQLDRTLLIKNSALSEDVFNQYFVNPMPYNESTYFQRDSALFNQYPDLSYLSKMCYCDTKTYMTDHNLTYFDKSIMAASIEGRPPLLDHRIVELLFKLPPNYKIKGNTQKYILKKVAEKYLPNDVIYRPKAPFSAPMRGWLKDELREMVSDILSESSLKSRGIYNTKYVQKLISDNRKGLADNSQLIWRLMVNEIWLRTYFN
jgi:asparagine synthase (glutamine-hydrolysing)